MKKEVWKEIEGYRGLYQISNLGRIKSLVKRKKNGFKSKFGMTKELILKPGKNNCNYQFVILCDSDGKKKRHYLHQIQGRLFIPNPEGKKCINHKDGDKWNNSIDNLEWCTYSENIRHGMQTNKVARRFCMLDLKNNILVKIYDYQTDVHIDYPHISISRVNAILHGKGKTACKKRYTFEWLD